MEQLFFFTDLQSIDVEALEGTIDPQVDEAFLSEVAAVFATFRKDAAPAEADAA
jgi:hypothetical protein